LSSNARRAALLTTFFLGIALGAGALPVATPALAANTTTPKPIPGLAAWQTAMKQYGAEHHKGFWSNPAELAKWDHLGHTYYDELRVQLQIAEYTKRPPDPVALAGVLKAYRDDYVLRPDVGGVVPGWWNFSTGLRMHFELTGDPKSKAAVLALTKSWGRMTPIEGMVHSNLIRETSYALVAQINAQALGDPVQACHYCSNPDATDKAVSNRWPSGTPWRKVLVDLLLGHLDQYVAEKWKDKPANRLADLTERENKGDQVSPFMVGIAADALIKEWEQSKDPRIVPALKRVADWMMTRAMNPRVADTMLYDLVIALPPQPPQVVSGESAKTLNLMIAPLYGFLWKQTGEAKYRELGDRLFQAAFGTWGDQVLYIAKTFHQYYIYSFDYVKWRQ
jgi:hypothetical protein